MSPIATKSSPIESVFGIFDGCFYIQFRYPRRRVCRRTSSNKIDITSRTLQTNVFDHTFVGYKRPISSPEKARANNPAALREGFRRNPLVRVSAGLSPLNTWFHSSIRVDSRISPIRLARIRVICHWSLATAKL